MMTVDLTLKEISTELYEKIQNCVRTHHNEKSNEKRKHKELNNNKDERKNSTDEWYGAPKDMLTQVVASKKEDVRKRKKKKAAKASLTKLPTDYSGDVRVSPVLSAAAAVGLFDDVDVDVDIDDVDVDNSVSSTTSIDGSNVPSVNSVKPPRKKRPTIKFDEGSEAANCYIDVVKFINTKYNHLQDNTKKMYRSNVKSVVNALNSCDGFKADSTTLIKMTNEKSRDELSKLTFGEQSKQGRLTPWLSYIVHLEAKLKNKQEKETRKKKESERNARINECDDSDVSDVSSIISSGTDDEASTFSK